MYETTLRSYNHQNYFYSIFLIFNLVNVIYVRIDLLEYIYIYLYIYIYIYIFIYICICIYKFIYIYIYIYI